VHHDEDVSKRNWNKCCVFTDTTNSTNILFPDGLITQDVLNGLAEQHQYPIHAKVALRIEELLQQERSGMDVDVALDIQLTISLLPPRFQKLLLRKITILPEYMLHSAALDDIGYIIRDIMVEKNNNDVLFKLYQYTMPFIKHNRLNFPPRRYVSKTVLKHLIQIVAFSCLGLHVHQSKKPVWNVRRKLFIFFTNLMLKGSLSDLYIFCHHHNYLVRLALIENFVHFTNQSMTLEMKFMRVFSGIAYEHTKVFRLVCYIADNFRMSALQNETLDWEVVELKAQIAIERCNRTCKSQPIKQIRLLTSVHNCWGYATENYVMRNLMTMPVVSKPMLFREMQDCDMLTMALRWKLNNQVRKYPLPVHIQHQQFCCIQEESRHVNQSSIVHRSLLYVCLRCCQQSSLLGNNMRVDFLQKPICVHCNSNVNVLTIETLGHLVRVFRQYYYFCIKCNRVHAWQGAGHEFFSCKFLQPPPPRKHCTICWRTNFLTPFSAFDKKLGVVQNFFLCPKHIPAKLQCLYAYDLTSLRRLIVHIQR
jgi:hypothetical protein